MLTLGRLSKKITKQLVQILGADRDGVHLIDGFSIEVCGRTRASRCKMFNDEVAYGYCASKEKPFYGFQGHLLVAANGIPVSLSLTRVGVFFNVKAEKPAIQFENLISA